MLFVDDLYEVQRKALSLSKDKDGFAFFMEMGLGKTRTVMYEAYDLFARDEADVCIILCPKTLRTTWQDEAEDIEFPYPVLLMDGTAESMWKLIDAAGPRSVVVIHYDIVLTKGGDLLELLINKGKRIYIALDESTRIKNPKAKVGKYLIQIRSKFKYRRVLSGAPNPQGPHDLWGQLRFVDATDSNYFQFRHTYCQLGGWQGKQVVGEQNIDILVQRTGHKVFRAKKMDWTDLPEKLPATTREIEMTARQKQAYKSMLQDFVIEWGDSEITAKMAVTAKTKLQQIGSGFLFDNESNVVHLFSEGEKNPKVEELMDIIEGISTKVIVFYYFRPTRDILANRFKEAGIDTLLFESGLGDEEYKALKYAFNNDDTKRVAICQVGAVKYGFTLIGNQETMPCHNTIFFENSYDAEARVQGEDRNHRHGQKFPVSYTDIAISPEDRKVVKALQRKVGLQEAILQEFQ